MKNDRFSHFIHHSFINSLFSSNFASNLKDADVLPTYKKEDKLRTIVQLVFFYKLSKIYERCIYDQMNKSFDQVFSKYQCGVRQGYITQHSLLAMVEKWKECLDKGSLGGCY